MNKEAFSSCEFAHPACLLKTNNTAKELAEKLFGTTIENRRKLEAASMDYSKETANIFVDHKYSSSATFLSWTCRSVLLLSRGSGNLSVAARLESNILDMEPFSIFATYS